MQIFDRILNKVASCMISLTSLQKADAASGNDNASALLSTCAGLLTDLITELKGFVNIAQENTRSLQALIFGGVVCPALDALVLLFK